MHKPIDWKFVLLGLTGLMAVYVFKHYLNPYGWFNGEFEPWYDTTENVRSFSPQLVIFNKTVRYILNDLFSIAIIQGLFQNRRYTRFAFVLLAVGLVVLLPTYFLLVYYAPAGYSSMVANLHRILMNPVLMMLLIPYFYKLEREKSTNGES